MRVRKKEPRTRLAARQRACRRRRLERIRRASQNFFLWQLQQFYKAEEINAASWIPVEEFFASSLIRDFISIDDFVRSTNHPDKTIEFAVSRIGGTNIRLIRPQWL
jgi:hypothetical protein